MLKSHQHTLIDTVTLDALLIANLRRKVPLLKLIQPLTEQQAEDLTLALSEHLTNLLVHSAKPCQIRICAVTDPGILLIYDNGIDISTLWQQVDLSVIPQTLAESGRGLWLIKQCFPALEYQSSAQGNVLLLPLPQRRNRLAVIDDDPMQIALMQVWLGNDFELECFSSPLRALDYLKLHPVDLIISDVCMPELDGLSLRRQLLQSCAGHDVPFLFLTALDDEQLKDSADELLIDDYLTKPIREFAFLRQKIRRLLNRQQHLRQSVEVNLDQTITAGLWGCLDGQSCGWQLQQAYRVASRGGGDFVFRQQREQSCLLVIGDVMGHGIQAKFFAYAISGYLYGLCHAVAQQQDPAQLLSQLSAAMAANELLQKTLVTLLVLELCSDGQVLLACAGHPPPWHYSPAAGLKPVAVNGVLPGLQAHSEYQLQRLQLRPQECLLAATDGVTEQFPGHDCLNENQLTTALAVLCSNPKSMNLMGFLQEHYQQPLADDTTLLSIRRL